ncbi:DUF3239 domain-containing protein [Microcoleus asticus]|uniref:Uncharacterized protein n=1 Tax=Microcoleus asticus IPMA8 TaxID=2563858 RepID=A0ABX2D5D8_9CYAN|nr:DUF3239 domain-containing protein [Microcoleus asticus]NQE37776.1 hypothetical protein [Microcoleus asticus IPMA8]
MTANPNRTFTLDNNTQASNPGGLNVNYLCWIRSFPQEPVCLISSLTVTIGCDLLVNWALWSGISALLHERIPILPFILITLFLPINSAFWKVISPILQKARFLAIHIRERCLYGCVNPGIVINSNPTLVAVFTDLRTGETPHQAIKVLPQPLKRTKMGIPPVGMRLATIALYEGNVQKGHWDDFHPIVINCVTDNQTDIDRVLQSIPDWEWLELELGLGEIPKQPGLYPISQI